jgi:cytochrome P450
MTSAREHGRGATAAAPAGELLFNPFDPKFRADPYPFYRRLRLEDPVHRSPLGMIVLSRHGDISRTLREAQFSRDVENNARAGSVIGRAGRIRARRRGRSMLTSDPPDHTRLRRLVQAAFTPSAIERLRPRIEQLVDVVLDRAADSGGLELVSDLAFPVPFQVISDLLAMPMERASELRAWSQALTQALEPGCTDEQEERAEAAADAMGSYLIRIIDERRRNPGGDVLSGLIAAEEAGDRLSTDELTATVLLLYVAGHETTVNLIGNGVLALLRHPDQLARWRDDPSLDSGAADELLRFDGPVQLTVRVPTELVRYGEIEVEPGTPVLALVGSGNHDPAVFESPDELRLDRSNAARHLAFGGGIHYCLGASLARAEAQIVIGRLIRRFPRLELVREPQWRDRLTIRGVSELHLALC